MLPQDAITKEFLEGLLASSSDKEFPRQAVERLLQLL
jgi:hypothetical protein